MKQFAFYTTEGCHLCEQAWQLVIALNAVESFEVIEIIHTPEHVERYGIRIPVVKNNQTGAELGWPFELAQLADFI